MCHVVIVHKSQATLLCNAIIMENLITKNCEEELFLESAIKN